MQDSSPTSTGTRTRVRPPNVRPMPADTAVHSGFVIVRLREGLAAADGDTLMDVARRLQLSGLVATLDAFDLSSARRTIRSLKPQQILELERKSASTEFPPLHSLTSYWRIDMRSQPERIDDVIKRLSALPEVDRAYRELATSEPLVNDVDDDYAADQDYLDAAPAGIDARWAWTQPNSEGAGVGFIDLEQGWFANHEDLLGKAPALIYGDNRDGVGTYKGNHGTAVLGEVVGIDNAVGIVGIAPAVTSVRMVSHYDADTDTALHVADAIAAAIVAMHPGDVLLLEVQRGVGQPTESDDNDFDALRLAVANGIIVVEAAGNGGVNLDTYTDGGLQVLNRGSADFRDSGAIMVGAAEALVPHDRANYSCFGSRIDCSSPDVILRPVVVADPNAEFGEGSGNENSMTLGYEAEAGQDNYIYVRVRNVARRTRSG